MKVGISLLFLPLCFLHCRFLVVSSSALENDGVLEIPAVDTANFDTNSNVALANLNSGLNPGESEDDSGLNSDSSSTTSTTTSTENPGTVSNSNENPQSKKMSLAPVDWVTSNVTRMLDDLLVGYDKRLRPDFSGPPTQVKVTVLVKNVASVNEKDMEFKLDFYLRQTWTDPRLAFNLAAGGGGSEIASKIKSVVLTSDFINKIFVPDTFFRNEKSSYVHAATVPNKFIRLHANGTMTMSTRMTVTASCHMDLSYYPMDKQACGLSLGSYSYPVESIQYTWSGCQIDESEDTHDNEGSVSVDFESVTLRQFSVDGYRRSHNLVTTSTGKYSALYFDFLFVRSLSYYMAKSYLPAVIVVTISYLALWFGRDSSYLLSFARMSVGITSVLTITTIYTSSSSNLSTVTHIKALDVYLLICFVGVFATLFTSFSMLYIQIMWKKREKKVDKDNEKEKKKKEKAEERKKKQEEEKKMEKEKLENMKNSNLTEALDSNGKEFIINIKNLELDDIVKVEDKGRDVGIMKRIQDEEKHEKEAEDDDDDEEDKDGKAHIRKAYLWLSKLDRSCRIFYPILFFLLNIIYWSYYLSASANSHIDTKWISLTEKPQ